MKIILLFTIVTVSLSLIAQAQPAVGTVSNSQTFAVRSGSGFLNSSLDAYEGTILVVMIMTPWCSTCKTNSISVGTNILGFFNNSSRAGLVGKNNNGVEIRSILLSTEPDSSYDTNNTTFSAANAFQQWGLDANSSRLSPRVMLNYYSGDNNSSSSANGSGRRQIVVLNLVRNSTSHAFRQIVINQNSFTSSNATAAQSAINAIQSAPATITFAQWGANYIFPSGTSGPTEDPDRDSVSNLIEFFNGTHPLEAGSRDQGPSLDTSGADSRLTYRRRKNIAGFTLVHQWSTDLRSWQTVPEAGLNPAAVTLGDIDQITVTVPRPGDSKSYYRLAISSP